LTTADALNAVAGQMAGTIDEYHRDVSLQDDTRESAVVSAFIVRVRNNANNQPQIEKDASDFQASLHKIRQDRDTEWSRRTNAMDNVRVLREVSRGLQKLAIQSLSLQDEMRRYLSSWIDARQRADAAIKSEQTTPVK